MLHDKFFSFYQNSFVVGASELEELVCTVYVNDEGYCKISYLCFDRAFIILESYVYLSSRLPPI